MRRIMPALGIAAALAWPPASLADDGLAELMARGQYRRASAVAEARLQSRPQDTEALVELARIRAKQRRFEEATRFAEQAVAAAPASADARFALAEVLGSHAGSAGMLKGLGLARRFRKEAEAALALSPDHEAALVAMAQFHRFAPGIAGGDREKGREFEARLMKSHPPAAWIEKAGAAFSVGDSAGGERCLRQAAAAARGARGKLELASYLAATGRGTDEAARLAREALEAEPWSIEGWVALALVEARGARWAEVAATLAGAESETGGSRAAHYQTGRTLLEQGLDAARSEQLFRRYLEVEPEIGAPSHAATWWRIGIALERQGKRPDAVAALETSVSLDPKFQKAKRDLKRLKGWPGAAPGGAARP